MSRLVDLTGQAFNADTGDHRFIAQYFAQFPSSKWLGSPHVLRALGLDPGAGVDESSVIGVLDRRAAGSTEKELIESQNSTRGGGRPSAHTHVHLTVRVPDDIQKSFSSKTPLEQEKIKRDLLGATDKILSPLIREYGLDSTGSGAIAYGYAALVTADQEVYRGGGPALPVQAEGLVVAIDRGDGSLVASDGSRLISEPSQDYAEYLASTTLRDIGAHQHRAPSEPTIVRDPPGVGFEF